MDTLEGRHGPGLGMFAGAMWGAHTQSGAPGEAGLMVVPTLLP